MRFALLLIFVLCFILTAFLAIYGEKYLSTIPVHIGLLSFSLFFLYEKNAAETLKKLGVFNKPLEQIGYGVAGFIALIVLAIFLNIIFYYAHFDDSYKIIDTVKGFPLYLIVFAIFFAPLSEELFFRALLIEKIEAFFGAMLARIGMNKTLPLVLALIISSALFAAAHFVYGSAVQFIGAFAIGLLLGSIYKHTRSIVPVIITHLLFNLTSLLAMKMAYGV